MLLNNLRGVNSNTESRNNSRETRDTANVLFVTSKQGHIFTGRPSPSGTRMWGGKNNKKKKTIKNKKQNKKSNSNKKSKTKKIDYYINHIYNKNK
jgi:hypothetical protein